MKNKTVLQLTKNTKIKRSKTIFYKSLPAFPNAINSSL